MTEGDKQEEPLTLELFLCSEPNGPKESRLVSITKDNEDEYALVGLEYDEFENYIAQILLGWEEIEHEIRPNLKGYLVMEAQQDDDIKFFVVQDCSDSIYAQCISVDTGESHQFKYEELFVDSLAYRVND
ncbi:hypothetical protein F7734_11460 [Scytonema sp. UIC 10036]|uniref:hypothetical protein n=1 Tax=Scytonema sp. UIC 10036 TaxID=2304196 RepID=UPI0012DAE73E|nr:hypothetical protein [Scytonema sp. UIC 10036]MUG93021.1 hypothetical protein [Scytonema sp. UIC 10036]